MVKSKEKKKIKWAVEERQLRFDLQPIEEVPSSASSTKVERVPSKPDELTAKSSTDFSQSLLDEMESMFRNLDTRRRDEASTAAKQMETSKGSPKRSRFDNMPSSRTKTYRLPGHIVDDLKKYRIPAYGVFGPDSRVRKNIVKEYGINLQDDLDTIHLLDEEESPFKTGAYRRPSVVEQPSQTLTKAERKKGFTTSTMKPMSAHDEKTLNTAVALANELTSKSMNDLGGEKKYPQSPNDRSKFHFRFPIGSHHSHHAHEPEKEKDVTGLKERRNFSEEAKSVPDLQASITAESKLAYTSLIEEPTPSSSLMTQLVKETSQLAKATTQLGKETHTGILKPATIPKTARHSHVQFNHPENIKTYSPKVQHVQQEEFRKYAENILPLPPRTTKPKLVDKPRHIRKYPLKLPGEPKTPTEPTQQTPAIIYQNTKSPVHKPVIQEADKGIDVFDGIPSVVKVDINTNPFTNTPGPSNANPFCCYYDNEDDDILDIVLASDTETDSEDTEGAVALVKDCKDHVSVEDLLEFADHKPCGRQRGVESDEVRIMCKVLKDQASPEQCLEALELSDWDVHYAIKMVRVKVSVGTNVSFQDCREQLEKTNRDVIKAAARLVPNHNNK